MYVFIDQFENYVAVLFFYLKWTIIVEFGHRNDMRINGILSSLLECLNVNRVIRSNTRPQMGQ